MPYRLRQDSPAITGGRGLKLRLLRAGAVTTEDSPAITGGRGLKHQRKNLMRDIDLIRPPLLAGVD